MRAVVHERTGGPEVLRLAERPVPDVPAGHVRVRVHVSGVNPTDLRSRSGQSSGMKFAEQIPHQDGAGVVDAIAADVTGFEAGQRVWLWDAAFGRPAGTAAEYVVLPAEHVIPLPDGASFELGASLGIPALTAHHALTSGTHRLAPGVLAGTTVLVHGGAGAVGHAAIQLARWAGAHVLSTVSSKDKARLAAAAGAHHVIDYRAEDVPARIAELAPDGVHRIVEVDLAANLATDTAVLANGGSINVYTFRPDELLPIPSLELLVKNARLGFTYTYTVDTAAKEDALAAVTAAVADGVMGVGTEHGLPLGRYELTEAPAAHAALEQGFVGKVLISVVPATEA
ncbi:NADPH:quinone reductase [Sciscionella sediminilitoris]|uniref:NADPH:quinone reductase n=1 Tax=Sciscionella sediminilitoris TaxID=1445613 RepID=UPI0004DF9B49|nr:NADPH:quinone reductase [Sciscionella sp. SE31]